jgi:hypothetical protein
MIDGIGNSGRRPDSTDHADTFDAASEVRIVLRDMTKGDNPELSQYTREELQALVAGDHLRQPV